MATFNSVDDTVSITMPQKGEVATFAISGTWTQTVRVQKEVGSPGSGAWSTIAEFAVANATVSYAVTTDFDNQTLRAIVQDYTSGSVTATWTDSSDAELTTLRDKFGAVLLNFLQSGAVFPGAATVTGNATITGTLTQTGNAALAGTLTVAGTSVLTGNTTITGTLTQTGTATLAADLVVDLNTTLTGTTLLTGVATFTVQPVFTAGVRPRVVNVTAATSAATAAGHKNSIISLNNTTGFIYELPAATGSGDVYEFIVPATISSGTMVIECTEGAAQFIGALHIMDDASGILSLPDGSSDDFINMNGGTTGGEAGSYLRIVDSAVDIWLVSGTLRAASSESTPFAAS